jgi:hypothetical protein
MAHQRKQEQNYKNKKQNPRHASRGNGDATESQDACNKCYHKED